MATKGTRQPRARASATKLSEPQKPAQIIKDKRSYIEDVVDDPALSIQFSRVGGNLTPQQVSAILHLADSGQPWRLVDFFHECRQKSGHLQSVWQTRELAVSGLDFDILPPEGTLKRDKKRAGECKKALARCESLRDMFAHLVGEGNAFGYAWSQAIWGMRSGLMVPETFKNISCRRFGFRQIDGKLLYDPTGYGTPVDVLGIDLLEVYPPGKFVNYLPRVNGDVMVREGLARLCVWMEMFRVFDISDWLKLAELAWKPLRTGMYKKGASKPDIAKLRSILERLTTNGVATFPETVELTLHWPQQAKAGQTSAHKELADFLADEESKAVLGQTDMVQPGPNGARAATATRNELRKDRLEADAIGLAKAFQRFIIEPFYQLNYGETDPEAVGQFVLLTEDPLDILSFAQSIAAFRTAGLRIPASYVYDKTGMPEPKADEVVLGDSVDENGKRVPAPLPPDPNQDGTSEGGNNGDGSGADGEKPPAEPKKPAGKSRRRAPAQPSP